MRATRVAIRRYRAFDREVVLEIGGLTVLTGPNNLGKSTVLIALRLFFSVFSKETPLGYSRHFEFDRDYPKRYVGRPGRRVPTRITVTFDLSDSDVAALQTEFGVAAPREISVSVDFAAGSHRVSLATSPSLAEPAMKAVFQLIAERIRYVYIPTGRGSGAYRRPDRSDVQAEIARLAFSKVRNTRRRLRALERFVEDAKDELTTLRKDIADELRRFMPDLQSVDFNIAPPDVNAEVKLDHPAPSSPK